MTDEQVKILQILQAINASLQAVTRELQLIGAHLGDIDEDLDIWTPDDDQSD